MCRAISRSQMTWTRERQPATTRTPEIHRLRPWPTVLPTCGYFSIPQIEQSPRSVTSDDRKLIGATLLVVAFSQKPGFVRSPGEVRLEGRSIPILHQGVAWVDASDFRIVRLRTDLTSPLPDIQLRSLTAEVQFAETQVAGVTSSLWLPREVVVTSDVNGLTSRDRHAYSNYRAYGGQTRLLLAP